MSFYQGEKVKYWSYIDGETNEGNIEYFTQSGMGAVAVIKYNGNIERHKGDTQRIPMNYLEKL